MPFEAVNTPVVRYPSRPSSATLAVSSITGEPEIPASTARDAPTEISGPMPALAVPSPASEVMWKAEPEAGSAESGGTARTGMSARTLTIVSAGVVIVVVAAMAIGGKKKAPAQVAAAPAPVVAAPATPVSAAPEAPKALAGDSTAIGLGPASRAAAKGKAPREVAVDAVALLQLSLPRPRATVGDTVHAHLEALDDAGARVTTPQVMWTTSSSSVVRFAGAGELLAVGAGKATITVTAGTTTTSRELTVVAKKK